jgi:hypothetical protein
LEVAETVTKHAVSEKLSVFPQVARRRCAGVAGERADHPALSKLSDCIGEPVPDGEDVVAAVDDEARRGTLCHKKDAAM